MSVEAFPAAETWAKITVGMCSQGWCSMATSKVVKKYSSWRTLESNKATSLQFYARSQYKSHKGWKHLSTNHRDPSIIIVIANIAQRRSFQLLNQSQNPKGHHWKWRRKLHSKKRLATQRLAPKNRRLIRALRVLNQISRSKIPQLLWRL